MTDVCLQEKSLVGSRQWWCRLMTLGLKGRLICEDRVVMGRWRGINNSSMNELKAERDIVKMLCRCAIGWDQLMRMADILIDGQMFE